MSLRFGPKTGCDTRLTALVKRVYEILQAGLRAFNYADEFTLWQIHPLSRQKKLTYECSRLVDLTREPSEGKISNYLITDV
jgi:hypothetical protein